jgi:hypothetical protein
VKEEKVKEFNFAGKKSELVLKICGKDYSFNASASNYKFVKTVASFWRETLAVVDKIAAMTGDSPDDLETAFDLLKDKEKGMVDFLMPGAWDELFEKAGYDLMDMMDMLTFIAGEIKGAGVSAKVESVKPATKGKREI